MKVLPIPRFSAVVIRFLMFLLILPVLTGCKKDYSFLIAGSVMDPNQNIKVEGVQVQVWTQRITSGIFEANYKLAGEQVTGPDGAFSIELEAANFTSVKLIFSKAGYFGWEAPLNLDNLKNNHGVTADYQLLPKAWVRLHVYNKDPFDTGDYFDYRLLNPFSDCEECCKEADYEFFGMLVDQVVECQTAGQQDLIIRWSKRKNKELTIQTETFFIKAFDTTRIELTY